VALLNIVWGHFPLLYRNAVNVCTVLNLLQTRKNLHGKGLTPYNITSKRKNIKESFFS